MTAWGKAALTRRTAHKNKRKAVKQERRDRKRGMTRTVKARIRVAVAAGHTVSEAQLIERMGWLAALSAELAQAELQRVWNFESFYGFADAELPGQASVAWERAFSRPTDFEGLYLPSRVIRIALAKAGRLLRAQQHELECCWAVMGGWPFPGTPAELINTHRRINRFKREHRDGKGKPISPADFFELAPMPPVVRGSTVSLGAVDECLCEWLPLEPDAEKVGLRLKLPMCERPEIVSDWVWHELTVPLPGPVQARLLVGARLTKPILKVTEDGAGRKRLIIFISTEQPRPAKLDARGGLALGLDWGERRTLTGAIGWLGEEGEARTDGRPLYFDSKGGQAHLGRMRNQARELRAKSDRVLALARGLSREIVDANGKKLPAAELIAKPGHEAEHAELLAQIEKLDAERPRVWAHYTEVSWQLGHAAARWAAETAKANGCTRIYHEDLSTLQIRGWNSSVNERVNTQLRGVIFRAIADNCEEDGVLTAEVCAANTSSDCPRCGRELHHQRSSNDKRGGRGWSSCTCGHTGDRDHCAAERILSIGMTGDHDARIRRSHIPALVNREPRPRSRPESFRNDRLAGPAGSAVCVRSGATPRDPVRTGDQCAGLRPITRSTKSSRRPQQHRDLAGMSDGFIGHARFTPIAREAYTTRHPPSGPSKLRTG